MGTRNFKLCLSVIGLLSVCSSVAGHGYLLDPPSRNSAWRVDPFHFEPNYSDNELNCGGMSDVIGGGVAEMADQKNQWNTHGGKCGICGDPYQGPREHEAVGKYAKLDRHVTRCYNKADNIIDIHVVITSYHKGFFEFRLCDHNNMATRADQSCFDNRALLTVHGTGQTRYDINNNQQENYHFRLDMPHEVTCTQCILQWKWNTGNAWGCDDTGCGTGMGPQEQFINCADIAILDDCSKVGAVTTKGPGQSSTTSATTTSTPTFTTPTPTPTGTVTRGSDTNFTCTGVGDWNTPENMAWWCTSTCKFDYSACPQNMCSCRTTP